jgi:hypothetical protein
MLLVRVLSRSAIAGLLLLQVFPAIPQEITMNGLARSASLFNALKEFCSVEFPVNTEEAQKYERVYLDVGIRSFGEKKFRAELSQEYARRKKEVEITRPAQWCAYQRERLEPADAKLFTKPKDKISADDMAMLLATLVAAQLSCGLKLKDYPPLNVVVARYGFNYPDFLPGSLYAPVVEVKMKKAKEFIDAMGRSSGCQAIIDTVRRFFPELV